MTCALIGYSSIFMRYALAVTPKNYLLFGCHVVNFSAQTTQAYRYINYWHMGGREKTAGQVGQKPVDAATDGLNRAKGQVQQGAEKIGEAAKGK